MIERTDFAQWRSQEVARLLALVETERRYYQDMVTALPVPLAVLSPTGALMWANRSFRRTFKLRSDDVRRKEIEQLLPGAGVANYVQTARLETAASSIPVEVDGHPARLTAIPMGNADDDAETETLLVLELGAPAAATKEQRGIPADLPAIVWTADSESTDFRSVAGAVEEFLGYPTSHWLDRAGFFEERIHPDDRPAVMDLYRGLLERGGDGSAEFRAVTASGDSFWCRESIRVSVEGGSSVGITGVLTNITRRKQMEQQLLTGARVEGLQALSGRLAHDLNNPLMIVNGYGEELLDGLSLDNPLRADAVEILNATGRIAAVAGKLTEVARKPAGPAVRVNVTEIVAALKSRLADAAGGRVTIDLPSGPAVWGSADGEQLAEVILAFAAPGEWAKDRTRLTVTSSLETLSERIPGALPPGQYACVRIQDDGLGMDAGKVAAVLDPNVNPAKAAPGVAAGTYDGVALTRAYGILRQWGGDIACASEPRIGTTFSIFLPRGEGQVAAPTPPFAVPTPQPEPEAEPETLRETILVVDDEAGIRGLMRKILRRERYEVLEAASAEEALKTAAAHAGPIQLLLTDVMLPGMLGPELARKLYALDPSLKVLYISGYTEDESIRTGEYPPGARFLAKPFTLGSLLGKVREALE